MTEIVIITRSNTPLELLKEFYAALEIKTDLHRHGGPLHQGFDEKLVFENYPPRKSQADLSAPQTEIRIEYDQPGTLARIFANLPEKFAANIVKSPSAEQGGIRAEMTAPNKVPVVLFEPTQI